MKLIRTYEPIPNNGRASFYGKCRVREYDDGTRVLESYTTEVIKLNPDGTYTRLWGHWSMTTGAHIYSFCSIRKKEWDKMQLGKKYNLSDLK